MGYLSANKNANSTKIRPTGHEGTSICTLLLFLVFIGVNSATTSGAVWHGVREIFDEETPLLSGNSSAGATRRSMMISSRFEYVSGDWGSRKDDFVSGL